MSDHDEEFLTHLQDVSIDVCCVMFGKSRGEIASKINSICEKGAFNTTQDFGETERKIAAMIGRDCYLLERT
jgi:hypothetical protein